MPIVVTFTLSSTWTCPAGVNAILVECWAAGGGGGGGRNATGHSAGGGGGGAYSKKLAYPVIPGTVYNVGVGFGGGGGTAAPNLGDPGVNGVAGGDSWFDNTSAVLAKGGVGGQFNVTAGPGGAAASGIGDTKFSGGNGANGALSVGPGGGGGSSAGTGSDGNNGSGINGGAAPTGGAAGGQGGTAFGNPPLVTAGAFPGGGGGGGWQVGDGAQGQGGQVQLTYDNPNPGFWLPFFPH